MDNATRLQLLGLAALVAAWLVALGLLLLLIREGRRRRQLARPDWNRMLADADYFRRSVMSLLQSRGYKVIRFGVFDDPLERQPREVVFALTRKGEIYAALAGRWVTPITSEMITRFEAGLKSTNAHAGLIIVTSYFSHAALERARGLPVELIDGDGMREWIQQIGA